MSCWFYRTKVIHTFILTKCKGNKKQRENSLIFYFLAFFIMCALHDEARKRDLSHDKSLQYLLKLN